MTLRLVTWNLRSGTDAKWDRLVGLGPDVAVLCEAAQRPRRCEPSLLDPSPPEWHWVGSNPAKGLGVATFGRPSAPILVNASARWSLAARVEGLVVVGVWSCPTDGRYAREVERALAAHRRSLGSTHAVVMGDFNVDPGGGRGPARGAAFARLARRFAALGLRSAYHHTRGEPYGAETRPTYYHQRNRDRPFHIDFCFVSEELLASVRSVEVGGYEEWVGAGVSDHAPVVVDLDR